jgi:hypothetical protein
MEIMIDPRHFEEQEPAVRPMQMLIVLAVYVVLMIAIVAGAWFAMGSVHP